MLSLLNWNTSIVGLNNTLLLYLFVVYLLLTTHYNFQPSLNFNIILMKRKFEGDHTGNVSKKPRLDLDENNQSQYDTDYIDSSQEQEENLGLGIQANPLNLDNGIDPDGQTAAFDTLNDIYFDRDYSSLPDIDKNQIASQISDLVWTYQDLGGYVSDLHLSARINDEFILNILRDQFGSEVNQMDSTDSDNESNNSGPSSDNGSTNNPGPSSDNGSTNNPGIGSNPSSNSTTNSNYSIMDRIIVWILLLFNEMIEFISQHLNNF